MRVIGSLAVLLLGLVISAQGTSDINWHVMSAGGLDGQSQTHKVRSTLGQTVIGEAASASYAVKVGFWSYSRTPVAVPEDETVEVPLAFRLETLVPNPSAQSARVSYAVPSGGGRVKIQVFDVSGALVRELVNGRVAPGYQVVSWDGRDHSGHQVASGVYLIRMEAPRYEKTHKLLLVR